MSAMTLAVHISRVTRMFRPHACILTITDVGEFQQDSVAHESAVDIVGEVARSRDDRGDVLARETGPGEHERLRGQRDAERSEY
jgi:hypothetical protein